MSEPMIQPNEIKGVIFDLGGVLVQLASRRALKNKLYIWHKATSIDFVNFARTFAKTAIVTGCDRDAALFRLEKAGIPEDLFDIIVTSDDVEKIKPDPEAHIIACAAMGTKHSETLSIQDSKRGIEAALAAGCVAWLVQGQKDLTQQNFNSGSQIWHFQDVHQ